MKSCGRPSEVIGWMGSSGNLRAYPKAGARTTKNADTARLSTKTATTGRGRRAKANKPPPAGGAR